MTGFPDRRLTTRQTVATYLVTVAVLVGVLLLFDLLVAAVLS